MLRAKVLHFWLFPVEKCTDQKEASRKQHKHCDICTIYEHIDKFVLNLKKKSFYDSVKVPIVQEITWAVCA